MSIEPTDQNLTDSVKKIIDESDLNTITFNMILTKLQSEYGGDLSPRKVFVSTDSGLIIE